MLKRQFSGSGKSAFGGQNRYWNNLISGVEIGRGEVNRPVVLETDIKIREVRYIENIFYSDHQSGINNGGRYNYYQQFYKYRR